MNYASKLGYCLIGVVGTGVLMFTLTRADDPATSLLDKFEKPEMEEVNSKFPTIRDEKLFGSYESRVPQNQFELETAHERGEFQGYIDVELLKRDMHGLDKASKNSSINNADRTRALLELERELKANSVSIQKAEVKLKADADEYRRETKGGAYLSDSKLDELIRNRDNALGDLNSFDDQVRRMIDADSYKRYLKKLGK